MPVRYVFLATLAACAAYGQTVVSVRSGLINFSEGEVYLSDQPRGQAIEQKAGKFPEVHEGVELRTETGRAEVLLTPGMVMRVGPDSAVRMVSASLIDTRVEFRRGSVVIEVTEDPGTTKARILYKDYEFKFPKKGTFRIDSMPREFRVYEGEADVAYLGEKCTLAKDHKMSLYGGLEAETLRRSITDGLDEWSMRRDTQLSADNPPPGDLNGGGGYDPGFVISPNAFYGLGSYAPPVSAYNYWSGYGYGLGGYGGYGYGYGYAPLPVYIYGGIYGGGPRLPISRAPQFPVHNPLRPPVSNPVFGTPRGGGVRPAPMHPVMPARPVMAPRPGAVSHPAGIGRR